MDNNKLTYSQPEPVFAYIINILQLAVIWLLGSILIITAGAASTALYAVPYDKFNEMGVKIFKPFWESFKSNFLVATAFWFIIATLVTAYGWGVLLIPKYLGDVLPLFVVSAVILSALAIETVFVALFVFPLLARRRLNFAEALKTAFFLSNRHFPTTLVIAVILGLTFLMAFKFPLFIFAAAGVYGYVTNILYERIFSRHFPVESEAEIAQNREEEE